MEFNDKLSAMLNNFSTWIRESITLRFILVAVLVLLLLIPAAMIRSLISERASRNNVVMNEISSEWAGQQTISGPYLTVPFLKGTTQKTKEYAHFLPSVLNIHANIATEKRNRGIYEVIVYGSDIAVDGLFDAPDPSLFGVQADDILWDESAVWFEISDMRGIKNQVVIKIDSNEHPVTPGIPDVESGKRGISVPLKLVPGASHTFHSSIRLNGSQKLAFVPLGKITNASITSSWSSPGFIGAFLPDKRIVDGKGFNAEWTVLELNRAYPQKLTGSKYDPSDSAFGVELLIPVDIYQKSERSVKYAIMFLALTFLVFLFTEILQKKRIHIVQYLMIGIGLCLFYTLLIALAEQTGFLIAYLIAASAVILLISFYAYSVLRSMKAAVLVGLWLSVLYLFLYVILQMEDYALLMGSIGLFVVLALTMFFSRRIDWFRTHSQTSPGNDN